jgi:LCP family protein required for cell wall assembly
VAATTGGRNLASLLTATPQPLPKTVAPTPTVALTSSALQNLPTVTLAIPTINQGGQSPVALNNTTPVTTIDASLPPIIQKIQLGEAFNILMLGYGGSGHDGAFLTDTILLIHYDPSKKAVTMTNIPRDLWVYIPYGGTKLGFWGKINAAFSYVMESVSPTEAGLASRYSYSGDADKLDAAANLAKDVVEQVTGVPIDYWVTFNFNGFRKLVDAIGGVDVTVDTAFDDYEYPANDDSDIDASTMHIHFNAGLQHMNGERAIEFARSRKSIQDGSDFARSKRQMKLIQAIKEKMSQPSIFLKAFDIMDALQSNMRTSFSFDELHALFDYYRSPEGKNATTDILFVSQILGPNFLTDANSSNDNYYLSPIAGQGNYQDIQQWIETGFENPEVRAENVHIQIHNGTGLNKTVLNINPTLISLGFQEISLDYAASQIQTVITDYSNGKAKYSLQALENLFPDALVKHGIKTGQTGPDLTLTLGQNYAATLNADIKPSGSKASSSSSSQQNNSLLNGGN